MESIKTFFVWLFTFIKNWIVGNGIESVLAIIIGLVLWIVFGMEAWAMFAFGWFACKNWDLIKTWGKSLFN